MYFLKKGRQRNGWKTTLWFVVVFATKIRESHSRPFWKSLEKMAKDPGFLKKSGLSGAFFEKVEKTRCLLGMVREKKQTAKGPKAAEGQAGPGQGIAEGEISQQPRLPGPGFRKNPGSNSFPSLRRSFQRAFAGSPGPF